MCANMKLLQPHGALFRDGAYTITLLLMHWLPRNPPHYVCSYLLSSPYWANQLSIQLSTSLRAELLAKISLMTSRFQFNAYLYKDYRRISVVARLAQRLRRLCTFHHHPLSSTKLIIPDSLHTEDPRFDPEVEHITFYFFTTSSATHMAYWLIYCYIYVWDELLFSSCPGRC